jgi:hypothetical protein
MKLFYTSKMQQKFIFAFLTVLSIIIVDAKHDGKSNLFILKIIKRISQSNRLRIYAQKMLRFWKNKS